MDLALVTARLDPAQVQALKTVGVAADFAAAAKSVPIKMPAAYVLPVREQAARNQMANAVSQRVTVAFAVILAVSNLRDARGGQAALDLESVRNVVKTRLIGWEPSVDHDLVTYNGGRLLELGDGVLWWWDEFSTAEYMRYV
ncbi:MAG: hypothetical protein AB1513_08860 [Pseudomonadota bacterium]